MKTSTTCCFTGHRRLPKAMLDTIKSNTRFQIQRLIGEGVDTFICGGAVGYDTLCAELVLEMREKHDISLVIAVPCRNQDNVFSFEEKLEYRRILALANEVVYLSEKYKKGCMAARNKFMVDRSQYVIAYCTRKIKSGTMQTIAYAEKNNKEVIHIK